jgi:calcium-translocating P-type ATPase
MEGQSLLPARFLYKDPVERVLLALHSSENGLSRAVANQKLKDSKYQAIQNKEKYHLLKIALRQFTNFLVLLMLIGASVSYFIGEYNQVIVISVVVLMNATIGFVQEYRAEAALEAFNKLIPQTLRVKRDNQIVTLLISQVVVGDVAIVSAGDMVPVDMRLIRTASLEINESALTGESELKKKYSTEISAEENTLSEIDNFAFAGTHVVKGEGDGVVTAIGINSVIGNIAVATATTKTPLSPLEKEIKLISINTAKIAILCGIILSILGFYTVHNFEGVILTVVSVMVAIVPEGLAAAVSVTLALGMLRMLKRKAIVKQLMAAETLGSVTVICSDKTGTLTENRIEPSQVLLIGNGENKAIQEWADTISVMCNDVQETTKGLIGDPLDLGLFRAVSIRKRISIKNRFKVVGELPFDSKRKRMSVVAQDKNGKYWCFTKGAPMKMLDHLEIGHNKKLIETTMDLWARMGEKVLILCFRQVSDEEWVKYQKNPENYEKELEHSLIAVSLVGLKDPPRRGVATSIFQSMKAGIRTIMITGDWAPTAIKIGRSIGLYQNEPTTITGNVLERLSVPQLARHLKSEESILFSEIEPRQKQKIVMALQQNGEVVCMTGDGVNDAPALKQSDIGVAMGNSGTDVARSAADIVLQNDAYSSIVAAVKEGRIIFNNIRKFIFFEFVTVAAQVIVVMLGLASGFPPVILPLHIIILDFWVGLLPSFALGVDPANPHIMDIPPRKKNDHLMSMQTVFRILRIGAVAAFGAWLSFAYVLLVNNWHFGDALNIRSSLYYEASTSAFLAISIFMILFSIHSRSDKRSLKELLASPNKYLYLAMAFSFLMVLMTLYFGFFNRLLNTYPLPISDWATPIVSAIIAMWLEDKFKQWFAKK